MHPTTESQDLDVAIIPEQLHRAGWLLTRAFNRNIVPPRLILALAANEYFSLVSLTTVER